MKSTFSLQTLTKKIDEKIVKEVELLETYAQIIQLTRKKGITKRIYNAAMKHMAKVCRGLKPVYNIVVERYPETKTLLDAIYEGKK